MYFSGPFKQGRPLLQQLDGAGLQFDGLLQQALEHASSNPDVSPEDEGLPDSYITLALYRLNSTLTRAVSLKEDSYNLFHEYKLAPPCSTVEVVPGRRLCDVLNRACHDLGSRKVIGTGDYIRAITSLSLDEQPWDYMGAKIHNTFSVETLLIGMGASAWSSLEDVPDLVDALRALAGRDPVEDQEYMLTLQEDRLVLRPASALHAFMMESGVGTAERGAVISRLQQTYMGTHASRILELEDLVNHPNPSEAELQAFFERNPSMFRFSGAVDVFPQVYLTREDDGPLIPDFILVDRAVQQATVLDLKLPTKKVAVGTTNRRRYSSAVAEARAQLQLYQEWFDQPSNRQVLRDRFGLEIYRPRLAVVIGRRTGFASELERQLLRSRVPEPELLTYDDILDRASQRLMLIKSAAR